MEEKKHVSFDVVKETLPKKKKVHYEWEKPQNHVLEPWHFSTVSLTLDVLILMMYLFIDQWIALQIPLGYTGLLLSVISIISIIMSYLLLKRKKWSISIIRYTQIINRLAIGITAIMILLTVFISA